MNFSDHQKQIWKKMLKLTQDYLEDKIEFSYLVSGLEGALDASDFKDNKLIKTWYDYWTPLEIINAETELEISLQEKKRVVEQMKQYLETMLEDQASKIS